jgi:hypothetical protein
LHKRGGFAAIVAWLEHFLEQNLLWPYLLLKSSPQLAQVSEYEPVLGFNSWSRPSFNALLHRSEQ